jgi:hypothetical protein
MSDPIKSVDGQTSAPSDKPSLLKRVHGFLTVYLKPEFLSTLVLLSELFGGLVFFGYVLHIRFMPEVDTTGFVTLLAAFALTGAFLILALGFALIAPGWAWKYTTKGEESLKSPFWFGGLVVFILGWFLYSFLYDLHVPRWWPTIVVWVVGIALPLVLLLFNKPWHWIVRLLERSAMARERKEKRIRAATLFFKGGRKQKWRAVGFFIKACIWSAFPVSEKRIEAAIPFCKREGRQKRRAAWFFLKGCFWSAVPAVSVLYIVVVILEENPAMGLYQAHPVLLTLLAMFLMAAILVWNMAAIVAPMSLSALAQIAAVLMILLFFSLQLWTYIPTQAVRILRFGNFKANLVGHFISLVTYFCGLCRKRVHLA